MTRFVPEWIADNDDQDIPKRVKDRIWPREGGRCYLTGRKIMPGDAFEFEHVIALTNGGQHRESNIRLALKAPHKFKTKQDIDVRVKTTRQRLKHNNLWPKSKARIQSRPFPKSRGQIHNGCE